MQPSPLEQLSIISKSHQKISFASAAIFFVRLAVHPGAFEPGICQHMARRLATAGLQQAEVMMTRTRINKPCTRVKFTLFRCTSEVLFFSCCNSVAAPRHRSGHHDQVPAKNSERRRGHRPRRIRIVQRCMRAKFALFRCTSAELFFSCCSSVAAPRQRPGHHDQVPAKTTSGAAGIGLGAPR